ncbi:MAG: envelope biogenesis factor ElyC [Deltaproteobacteria bacterium]|nr:envelope biogenesis factor ElyC [Deltaproteobacteria bacterium]
MMFLLKKIAAPLFLPVSLCLELLLAGLVLLWFTRRQKAGKILVLMGVILLAALSYSPLPETLLRPLEYRYPPVLKIDSAQNIKQDIKWVVVLGGGHTSNPKLPSTSQLSYASIARLVEGIRLYRKLPGSRLILSGGNPFGPVSNARVLADVAMAVGVDRQNLVLEPASKDTKDEAMLIQKIVGDDRFFLVTSASHMPRSMALFKKRGMHPLPAPAGHLVKDSKKRHPGRFFPWTANLAKAERAFHEYLGLAWAKLRGQM